MNFKLLKAPFTVETDGYLTWMQETLDPPWWILEQKKQTIAELKVCASTKQLERGKELHKNVTLSGNDSCSYVGTALLNMYSKCGSMSEAKQMFDDMEHTDVVSWTALISGYAENGEGSKALDLFARMRTEGCEPNSYTFVAAFKACTSLAVDASGKTECFERGKKIHAEVPNDSDIRVYNTLIDMYTKCGKMLEAQKVLDGLKSPNVISWNTCILGYAENGDGATALALFERMKFQGCSPDAFTIVAALKGCISLTEEGRHGKVECLKRGKQIHSQITCSLDIYVESTLIIMYGKCSSMLDARRVFNTVKPPNVVTWTALIFGYAENGESIVSLDLYAKMKREGCIPNDRTFVAALRAAGLLGALETGRKVHAEMDAETIGNLVTCLVDFYAKCGSLVEARTIFNLHPKTRDLKTWTALLAGYSRLGEHKPVFQLLKNMQDEGIQPDGVTFVCLLTCCSHAGLAERANELFTEMSTRYGISPGIEHYNCMVDILGRSRKLHDVFAMFRKMPSPDSISWMTLFGACGKWKNVALGRLAFESLLSFGDTSSFVYVLMAHIYRSRGMWAEQEATMQELRRRFQTWKESAQSCWTNEVGEVHLFSALN